MGPAAPAFGFLVSGLSRCSTIRYSLLREPVLNGIPLPSVSITAKKEPATSPSRAIDYTPWTKSLSLHLTALSSVVDKPDFAHCLKGLDYAKSVIFLWFYFPAALSQSNLRRIGNQENRQINQGFW